MIELYEKKYTCQYCGKVDTVNNQYRGTAKKTCYNCRAERMRQTALKFKENNPVVKKAKKPKKKPKVKKVKKTVVKKVEKEPIVKKVKSSWYVKKTTRKEYEGRPGSYNKI